MNLFLEKNIILQGLSGPFNWGYISCNPNFTYSSFSQVPKSQPPPPRRMPTRLADRTSAAAHAIAIARSVRPLVPPSPPRRPSQEFLAGAGRPAGSRRGRVVVAVAPPPPLSQECASRFLPLSAAPRPAPAASVLPDTYTKTLSRRKPASPQAPGDHLARARLSASRGFASSRTPSNFDQCICQASMPPFLI